MNPKDSRSRREFIKTATLAAGAAGLLSACARDTVSPEGGESGGLSITLGGYEYDRIQELADGRVAVKGCNTRFEPSNIYELNAMAMGGDQKWEVQEIGLHPYMLAYANDDFRDYTLIPVFPLRTFRHKSVYIRTDRGIEKPEDLRGKTVATPGYSMSSLVWIRGFLQHEYGVEPADMQWIVTASSDGGKNTKNESVLPEGVPITRDPEGRDEGELLASGEVDAVLTAVPPKIFREGNPDVNRLFPDYRRTEREYFASTGLFPIMHVVAIRSDVAEQNPWLPEAVFNAYSQSKHNALAQLFKMGWANLSLPWAGNEIEQTRELMGDNFWPYAIEPNRKTLEALFLYSYEQGLAQRQLTIKELFHPSTLELAEPS